MDGRLEEDTEKEEDEEREVISVTLLSEGVRRRGAA
jgi:hypothetical protein